MVDEILKERMVRNLKIAIGDHWGNCNNGQEVLKEMYLSDLKGNCFPDKYIGEDILKEIEDKFYFFLGAIRDELPQYIEIYVTPSYEDATTYLMILDDRLLLNDYMKAWNFWFESEEKLMDEMYSIYRSLLAKSEKTYECYTLCDADIQAVADRKGLDLDGIDLNDVVHYIKKGIAWGLDDVRDEIIEDAIKLSGVTKECQKQIDVRDEIIEDAIKQADDPSIYEPSSLEMQKAERRAMGLSGCQ